jgi:hypothetical protein
MFLRPKREGRALSDLGLYSIVRYVDDLDRGEAVNVGVLLEANGELLPRFVVRDELQARNETILRFEQLVHHLIERGEYQDAGEDEPSTSHLAALSRRRFPHFEITEPRQFLLASDPTHALNELAQRLVESGDVFAVSRI